MALHGRFRPLLFAVATIGPLIAACASKAREDVLDCGYLAGPSCWSVAVSEAATCAPPAGSVGAFPPDNGLSCAYTGSPVTVFFPVAPAAPTYEFALLNTDQPCAELVQHGDGATTLTTASGAVTITKTSDSLAIACPDGTTRSAKASDVAMCAASTVPGTAAITEGPVLSFSLVGGPGGTTPLFSCDLE